MDTYKKLLLSTPVDEVRLFAMEEKLKISLNIKYPPKIIPKTVLPKIKATPIPFLLGINNCLK